ncbi:MAG: transketolase C-terminal domain-containing protein [Angelakisella sp.]|nr:transketolase C-terminal domain-containing protein [Angelakisella sp.]
MAEIKKMALRDAYGNALAKLGGINDKVVALEADVGGSTKSAVFGKAYPDRYYNVGIAELNMVSMAAGMASCGMIPFVNTFSVFLATRGADPIQSLLAYDNMHVICAGTYCGMSDSYDGASHHAITDMAFVRSIPGMTLISVCDPVETEKAVFAAAKHNGPVYLRLSRADAPYIFDDSYNFEIGKGVELKEGKDVTIVATGYMVHKALEAAQLLKAEGIDAGVVNIHTVEPIDSELIVKCAKATGAIVTAEEHSIRGGLGSAVAEVLASECPVPMGFVGSTQFAESGDYEQLLTKYGLDAAAIAAKAKETIAKK